MPGTFIGIGYKAVNILREVMPVYPWNLHSSGVGDRGKTERETITM